MDELDKAGGIEWIGGCVLCDLLTLCDDAPQAGVRAQANPDGPR